MPNQTHLLDAMEWGKSAQDVEGMHELYDSSVSVVDGIPVESSIYYRIHYAIEEYVEAARYLSGWHMGYVSSADVSRQD